MRLFPNQIYESPVNSISLRFKDLKLDAQFDDYHITRYLQQLRLAHVLAIVFYLVAVYSETYLFEENAWFVNLRLIVVVSSFIIGYVVTFVWEDFYKRYYKSFNIYYVLITGISFILSGANVKEPYTYSLYSGLIVSLIFNYTFIKQDFVKASAVGGFITLIYLFLAFNSDIKSVYLFHISIYVIVVNFLGMFICYLMEWDARRSFLMLQKIDSSASELKMMNENLEQNVRSRTAELEEANVELVAMKDNLEQIVNERTKDLTDKNDQLERMNTLFVGREFRIKELRDRIKELENELGLRDE